jgi:hypothetical protein
MSKNRLRRIALKKDRGRKPRFGREDPGVCAVLPPKRAHRVASPKSFLNALGVSSAVRKGENETKIFLKSHAYFFFDRFSRLLAH